MPPKKGNKEKGQKKDAKKMVADKTFGMKNVRILIQTVFASQYASNTNTRPTEEQVYKSAEASQRDRVHCALLCTGQEGEGDGPA